MGSRRSSRGRPVGLSIRGEVCAGGGKSREERDQRIHLRGLEEFLCRVARGGNANVRASLARREKAPDERRAAKAVDLLNAVQFEDELLLAAVEENADERNERVGVLHESCHPRGARPRHPVRASTSLPAGARPHSLREMEQLYQLCVATAAIHARLLQLQLSCGLSLHNGIKFGYYRLFCN